MRIYKPVQSSYSIGNTVKFTKKHVQLIYIFWFRYVPHQYFCGWSDESKRCLQYLLYITSSLQIPIAHCTRLHLPFSDLGSNPTHTIEAFHNFIDLHVQYFHSTVKMKQRLEKQKMQKILTFYTQQRKTENEAFFVGWAILRCLSTTPHPIDRARGSILF